MIVLALAGTAAIGLIVAVILARMAFLWVMDYFSGDGDEQER